MESRTKKAINATKEFGRLLEAGNIGIIYTFDSSTESFIMNKLIASFLCIFSLAACASVDNPSEGKIPDTPMRVLFIGNSFLVDASEFLPMMLKVAGISTVEMDRMYHGGYTLSSYNANYDNASVGGWMTYRPGYASWKGDNSYKHSVRDIVESGLWDCVLFNDGSSAGDIPTDEMLNDIDALISKIKAHQGDHPVKFYFVNTQPDGYGYSTLVEQYNNDQQAQFRAKSLKARTIVDKTAIDDVISTGAMIQNLRSSVVNISPKGQDLSRDGHHLDYGIARYGAACTVFGKIFTPVYGVDFADIKIRTEWACKHPSLYCTPVTFENAPLAIKAAKAALEEPYLIISLASEPLGTVPDEAVEVLDEVRTVEFPVVFPLGYKGGSARVTADTQSRLRSEGVWECSDQPQAYARWHWGPRDLKEQSYPYVNYLASQSKISSPEPLGLWDGDYWEFMIPVENFPGGTELHFYAPFYGRQNPVFWDMEYYDEGQWKVLDKKERTAYGHTCECSLVLGLGTTFIDEDIQFKSPIGKGWVRIRLKVVKGAWQVNTSTNTIDERTSPYIDSGSGKYAAPVYFHTDADGRQNAVVISLK